MSKLLASAAVAAVLAFAPTAVLAQDDQPLSPKQQEAVKKLVRDYIMTNPEIIAEAIEALREKHRLAAEEQAARALFERTAEVFDDPADPIAGNPQGDVVLVEFFDYRCGYCKTVADTVFDVLKADGKIKLVFKELPILGPESVIAARAALASAKQGKYEAYHRALMKMRGKVDEQSILKTAAEVGLDVGKLKADMADPEIEAALRRNLELARALDIGGTPAFVIGDRIIPGAVDRPTLQRLIEEARKPTEQRK